MVSKDAEIEAALRSQAAELAAQVTQLTAEITAVQVRAEGHGLAQGLLQTKGSRLAGGYACDCVHVRMRPHSA